MSKHVLLNLEAQLQSWGEHSRFKDRTTLDHPTKSGVVGLICCAMGIRQKEEPHKMLAVSSKIKMRSFTIRKGSQLRDFQSIGTCYSSEDVLEKRYLLRKSGGAVADCPTKIFHKEYLQGARFLVDVEVDDDTLAQEIQAALRSPRWPMYLGRKCCVPTAPVACREGVLDTDEQVLAAVRSRVPSDTFAVQGHVESPDGTPILDEPLGDMRFGTRYVQETYVKV